MPGILNLFCAIFPNASTYVFPLGYVLYTGNIGGFLREVRATEAGEEVNSAASGTASTPRTGPDTDPSSLETV